MTSCGLCGGNMRYWLVRMCRQGVLLDLYRMPGTGPPRHGQTCGCGTVCMHIACLVHMASRGTCGHMRAQPAETAAVALLFSDHLVWCWYVAHHQGPTE
jgi:hypothetical protein